MSRVETERLIFRPLELGDEEYIFPEVDTVLTEHWIGWEPPRDMKETRKEVVESTARAKQLPNIEFVAFNTANEFIGCCGISLCTLFPSAEQEEYEIDLWVKHSEQSKGYGKEMTDMLIAWARGNTELPYLVYSVTKGNLASEKIATGMHLQILREFTAMKRGMMRSVTDYKLPLR